MFYRLPAAGTIRRRTKFAWFPVPTGKEPGTFLWLEKVAVSEHLTEEPYQELGWLGKLLGSCSWVVDQAFPVKDVPAELVQEWIKTGVW
jgi:hypothetical protein